MANLPGLIQRSLEFPNMEDLWLMVFELILDF